MVKCTSLPSHCCFFPLHNENPGSHVHIQRQKPKNKTLFNIVLAQFQRGKRMAHILGNVEWNQKEQLQPAPKSSDFPKLKPAQILYVLNGWELQKYFFLTPCQPKSHTFSTLSFIRNEKQRKYDTKSKKKLLESILWRYRKTLR